ncbi:MAG: hypothetical protein PHP01_08745 [Phycisphaerae bacterium]|nr:hypothetical protein [Phycisphaerae bacterium]
MKKLIALVAVCMVTALVIPVFGEDANEPAPKGKKIMITGIVNAVKDKQGELVEVIISDRVLEYNVVIDAKGKELGALKGKFAKVIGIAKIENQVKWLTVLRFELAAKQSF